MRIEDIQTKAYCMGINSHNKNKLELIREIQIKEGNRPCYATGFWWQCPYNNCLWREDCCGLIKFTVTEL